MRDTKSTLIYILKRLCLMIVTFVIIFTICFFLIRLLPLKFSPGPGDSEYIFYEIQVALGRYTKGSNGEYYQTPLLQQFFTFVKNLFAPASYPNGDGTYTQVSRFGYAWSSAIGYMVSPVEVLFNRMPPTIFINVYSIIISTPIGLLLGIYMALRKNKWQDHALSIFVMLLISVPGFVYAFFLQYLLGYANGGILPPTLEDRNEYGWFSPEMLSSMVLPVIAMSLGSIAGFARYTRAELTEVLTSDFMLLARTKGLTRAQATVRHAFRNSLVPIFPMILGQIISVLSGSVVIEQIFAVGGVGSLFLDSINNSDYDVFQFVGMFYVVIGLVGGLVVAISYGLVDPRIRMGGGKQ